MGFLCTLIGPSRASDDADVLSQLYALLQRTQNEVVNGGADLLPLQSHVLETLGVAIDARAEDALWSDDDQIAVIGYGLAGGEPRSLTRMLGKASLSPASEALVRGLIAFRRSRPEQANSQFALATDEAIPRILLPAVAMVRGALAMENGPEEAVRHFRRAMQLAPGTLVEEAALRRLMVLNADDSAMLFKLAHQYWQRFPKSPYRHRVSTLLRRSLLTAEGKQNEAILDGLLPLLPAPERFAFLAELSRQALLAGQSELVRVAVSRMRVAETGAREIAERNSELLVDIARLTGSDVASVAQRLEQLDPALLSRENKALLVASRRVAEAILAPFVTEEGTAAATPQTDAYRTRLSEIDRLLDD